jgi:phenylpyruvate tautomerase PptA (4-oxalocrotonate tautomerase family)
MALVASIGCSTGSESTPSSPEAAVERAVAGAPTSDGTDANACLLAYQTKYDELLPLTRAAQAAGLSADQAETDYSRVMKNPQYHEVQYKWPSNRVRTIAVAGRTMDVPRDNIVGLGGMRAMNVEYFRNSYRAVTADEKAELDRKIDTSEEKGLETEQQKAIAKRLTGVIAEVTRAYRDVAGVGEAASFNTVESKLYVLDRGVSFAVLADVSDDPDANERLAVGLARQILANCPR